MSNPSTDFLDELSAWKAERLEKLMAPDGWLNVTDRLWLPAGTSRIGSAPDTDLTLSVGPPFIGTVTVADAGDIMFCPSDGRLPVALPRDPMHPSRFSFDNLLLEIMVTNDDVALRVRDTMSPQPGAFPGLDYFPPDPAWRVKADWVAFAAPHEMILDTSKSIPNNVRVTHKACFNHEGQRYELIATHGTPKLPQFVIRDETSKSSTYAAARFLYGEILSPNVIMLDFNRAYNPPCAFTEHAVCPLPPPENILPFAVTAGELKPKGARS